MADEMKKGGLYYGAGSEDEAENNGRKYRLPFALCKQNGISIKDWWTPSDAWNALEDGGFIDDVSEEYKEYFKKLKKRETRSKDVIQKGKSPSEISVMTQERRKQIEDFGKEVGLSFVDAKRMLEEIEQDIDNTEIMRKWMFS